MSSDQVTKNSVVEEFNNISSSNSWAIVYQKIGRECQAFPYTCEEAKKPNNKPLNRYRDVSPYDHTRIVLKRCKTDYINANLVKMCRANRKYILTQGPLARTVSHFWSMVWEQQSRAILMLNKVIEKNELKCSSYWPQGTGDQNKLDLTDVNLVVEQISEEDFKYFTTRTFKISDTETDETREVIQFHYTTWPDFGVPSCPEAFLKFLVKVRASGALEPDVGPAIVHCSAGIGRSGTFCLVDSVLVIIEKEGTESVNILQVLLDMRRQRMGLIQTPDQLRFSYLAIIEGIRRLDPNWKEDENAGVVEDIYSEVAEDAPCPPPRGESLSRAPARPLPAIPASSSLGELKFEASGSLAGPELPMRPPMPLPEESLLPIKLAPAPATALATRDSGPSGIPAPVIEVVEVESSSEDEPPVPPPHDVPSSSTDTDNKGEGGLRQRRMRDMNERVSAVKHRTQDAEDKLNSIKRSFYKPLTITFGVLIAGILIYSYVKH